MQASAKKLKGFQWYNQGAEQEILGIEPERPGFGYYLKNKTPILRGFERTFCSVVSGFSG
jgi:hypothetical protein